jgi:CRISPR/Cas system endoribonuclease Cas6 (RAMP superfamily)
MDFKEFIARATQVETIKSDLRWHDWTRYSARQDKRMKLGGLMGSITYAGELKPFLPFIALGRYTHVGKNATFGLGKYRIEKI